MFELFTFCKYESAHIYNPHEGNLSAEIELEILVLGGLLRLYVSRGHHEETTCTLSHFFQKSWTKIVYLKWALAICKTCRFITLQENIIVFVHNIMPLKRMFDAWYKYAQNFFIPEFDHNFCHAFTCHNTIFIYQQLNIIAPWNFFFQTHHHSYLKLDGSITDWFSKHS